MRNRSLSIKDILKIILFTETGVRVFFFQELGTDFVSFCKMCVADEKSKTPISLAEAPFLEHLQIIWSEFWISPVPVYSICIQYRGAGFHLGVCNKGQCFLSYIRKENRALNTILWILPLSSTVYVLRWCKKRRERVNQSSAYFLALSSCSAPTCELKRSDMPEIWNNIPYFPAVLQDDSHHRSYHKEN